MTRRRRRCEIRLGLDSARQQIHEAIPAARDPRLDGLSTVFSLAGRGGDLHRHRAVLRSTVRRHQRRDLLLASKSGDIGRHELEFGVANSTAISIAAVNVMATFVAVVLVDRVGDRPLLLASLVGVALGRAAMAVGAGLHATGTGHIFSVAGLYLFIVAFAIGLGPIAWVAAAELLPIRVRGIAMGMVVGSHWLFDALASPTGLRAVSSASTCC